MDRPASKKPCKDSRFVALMQALSTLTQLLIEPVVERARCKKRASARDTTGQVRHRLILRQARAVNGLVRGEPVEQTP